MRVLVGGSNGFIGSQLVKRLKAQGHDVTRLVRHAPGQGEIGWESINKGIFDDLDGFNAVINLGGVGIGERRWKTKEKGRIWDSRIDPTEALAHGIASVVNRPDVFICASAVGFYGDRGSEKLTESSSQGEGFLPQVCYNWEDATKHASEVGIRTVNLRTGVVLGAGGGALARQLPLFKLGIGGRLGSGDQYLSWISLRDHVDATIFAISSKKLSGPVNLTSPNPVTNREFTTTLGRILNRPTFIPAWPWMLRLAFGAQLTNEMLLASQRVIPRKLEVAGFSFRDPELADALVEAVRPSTPEGDEKTTVEDEIVDVETGALSKRKRPGKRQR